jgi:uncharacterized protein YceK
MWRRTAVIVVLAAPALLSGCGTLANIQSTESIKPPGGHGEVSRIYGGVQTDCTAIRASAKEVANGEQDSVARLFIWTFDLPLSLIGDTLTLPYTLTHPTDLSLKSGQRGALPDAPKGDTPTRGAPAANQ